MLKAPGAELCQNTCGVVNEQNIFCYHQCSPECSINKFRAYTSTDTCFVIPRTHQCVSGWRVENNWCHQSAQSTRCWALPKCLWRGERKNVILQNLSNCKIQWKGVVWIIARGNNIFVEKKCWKLISFYLFSSLALFMKYTHTRVNINPF